MTGITALGLPEARRNEAAALFRARGVPHRRIEDWKYSDLKSALGEGGIEGHELVVQLGRVLVDGGEQRGMIGDPRH